MFKKLMLGLAIAGVSICAQASTLYWQVDQDGGVPGPFTIANLKVTDGTTQTTVASVGAIGTPDANTGTTTGAQQSDISSWSSSGYSFFVELMTYTGSEWTSKSGQTGADWNGTWNYDDLVSQGYVSTGSIDTPTAAALGGVNFGTQAPEPTSGLLMVLGGALLALRRRRS